MFEHLIISQDKNVGRHLLSWSPAQPATGWWGQSGRCWHLPPCTAPLLHWCPPTAACLRWWMCTLERYKLRNNILKKVLFSCFHFTSKWQESMTNLKDEGLKVYRRLTVTLNLKQALQRIFEAWTKCYFVGRCLLTVVVFPPALLHVVLLFQGQRLWSRQLLQLRRLHPLMIPETVPEKTEAGFWFTASDLTVKRNIQRFWFSGK